MARAMAESKTKIVRWLLLVIIATISLTTINQTTAVGQDATATELPLALKMGAPGPIGIEVSAHFIRDRKHGLTKEVLHSAVELGLRRNNVAIIEPRVSSLPYLLVEVATLKITGFDTYVYDVSVSLYQFAQFLGWSIGVSTWSRASIGYAPSDALRQTIRDTVLEIVDDFSLDYLRAKELSDAAMEKAAKEFRQELEALRESGR